FGLFLCRCVFFFQAEDGIRDATVTGVQTCALPIFRVLGPACLANPFAAYPVLRSGLPARRRLPEIGRRSDVVVGCRNPQDMLPEIGRASCRERVELADGGVA